MPTEFATSSVTGQPAFNEFGLTSLQNMAKDKVVEETAKFGLGTFFTARSWSSLYFLLCFRLSRLLR